MKFKEIGLRFLLYFGVCAVLLPLMEYVYSLVVHIDYVFTLKEYLLWAIAFGAFWTLRDIMKERRGI